MDPRPLTTEPLALDLVNTVWVDDAGRRDLFDDAALSAAWLARWELTGGGRLLEAREAIRRLLEHRRARGRGGGRRHPRTTAASGSLVGGETLEVPAEWESAWYAVSDLRNLLADRPDRIKHCANPDCVLWFADTTRSGTRRWCSMTGGCGSRLKARRHAERTRPT